MCTAGGDLGRRATDHKKNRADAFRDRNFRCKMPHSTGARAAASSRPICGRQTHQINRAAIGENGINPAGATAIVSAGSLRE